MKISTTAKQTGFGTDQFKRVTHLSADERAAINAGEIVVYNCGKLSGGTHGTPWRQARKLGRYYVPRVPAAAVVAELEALAQ